MSDEACRLDVWLHRARFMRTRALAAAFVEAGRVRVTRGGAQQRVDRPGRPVRVGDELLFAIGGRVTSVRIAALGERRGPPDEARALYSTLSPEG
ncbi:S4 domain-containing protein [Brevundimonas sp.]|uniref:S4 domain-containing protein n=1 Tax=Brevundimonas sp. TaxID=1871086 RepID=UPI00391873A4